MFKVFTPLMLLVNCYLQPISRHDPLVAKSSTKLIQDAAIKKEITQYAKKIFGENLALKEHHFPADHAESGSGSVYFVFNTSHERIGLIKVFDDEYSYERELSLYQALDLSSYNDLHYAPITHHMRTEDEKGGFAGFLVQELAKGSSLNSHLKNITLTRSMTKDSPTFKHGLRSVELTAISMAEMHKKHQARSILPSFVANYNDLRQANGLEPLDHFPGPFGTIHGDSHPGNLFYDTKSDTLTFIDFGSAHVATEKHPRYGAPAGDDVANFVITLKAAAKYFGLTQSEIDRLETHFLETYFANNPKLSKEDYLFYAELVRLDYSEHYKEASYNPFGQSQFYAHHFLD